jgi:integrase
LSDEELRAVWYASTAAGWPFGAMTKLLILTGQRRSEVAEMRWSEIDFETRLWTMPRERCKSNREHTVLLSEPAAAILKTSPQIEDSDLIFSKTGTTPVSGFSRAKARLDAALPSGMPGWVLHDLRRTFASGCARLGVAIHVVERLLGHTSGTFAGIVGVYQRHDFSLEQRAAVNVGATHRGLVEKAIRGLTRLLQKLTKGVLLILEPPDD